MPPPEAPDRLWPGDEGYESDYDYSKDLDDPELGEEFCGRTSFATLGNPPVYGTDRRSSLLYRVLLDCVEENLDISEAANRILQFRAQYLDFSFGSGYSERQLTARASDFPQRDRTWFRRSRQVHFGRRLREHCRVQVEDIIAGWCEDNVSVFFCEDQLRWALAPRTVPAFLCEHATGREFVIPQRHYLESWWAGRTTRVPGADFYRPGLN